MKNSFKYQFNSPKYTQEMYSHQGSYPVIKGKVRIKPYQCFTKQNYLLFKLKTISKSFHLNSIEIQSKINVKFNTTYLFT